MCDRMLYSFDQMVIWYTIQPWPNAFIPFLISTLFFSMSVIFWSAIYMKSLFGWHVYLPLILFSIVMLIMALTNHLYYHWSNEVIQLLLPIIILLTIACGIVVIIELTLFYDTIKDYVFLTVLFHVPMLFWLIYIILVFIRRESSTIKTEIARMKERAKPAHPI